MLQSEKKKRQTKPKKNPNQNTKKNKCSAAAGESFTLYPWKSTRRDFRILCLPFSVLMFQSKKDLQKWSSSTHHPLRVAQSGRKYSSRKSHSSPEAALRLNTCSLSGFPPVRQKCVPELPMRKQQLLTCSPLQCSVRCSWSFLVSETFMVESCWKTTVSAV